MHYYFRCHSLPFYRRGYVIFDRSTKFHPTRPTPSKVMTACRFFKTVAATSQICFRLSVWQRHSSFKTYLRTKFRCEYLKGQIYYCFAQTNRQLIQEQMSLEKKPSSYSIAGTSMSMSYTLLNKKFPEAVRNTLTQRITTT